MRIYMQKAAEENKAPRFYHLIIQQDLLGGWTLIKESGTQGSKGRIKLEHFASRDEAEQAMTTSRDAQVHLGYHVVFVDGLHK